MKFIAFYGATGEPLLNPHFTDIVKYLKNKNPEINLLVNANGTLLKDKIIKGMVENNFDDVLIKLSELEVKVDDIYTVINSRLDNISTQLKELDKIETMAELLEEVQADQENLDKKQGETTDTVGASSSGIWLGVILLIIVILLLLMILARGGKGKGSEEVALDRDEPEEDIEEEMEPADELFEDVEDSELEDEIEPELETDPEPKTKAKSKLKPSRKGKK